MLKYPDDARPWEAPTQALSHPSGAIGPEEATIPPPVRIRAAEPATSSLSFDSHATHSAQTPPPRIQRFPVVPGYELVGELGRGGMGVVYRANQTRLNRMVALKMLLNAETADLADVVRFRSEAEAVAAVRHPNIVQVHEFGHADGKPYLAMEFLSGGTLYQRLRTQASFGPRAAAELVAKLARAIQAAHAEGIVHRDLKPGNILFDDTREPRVTDFGLAKRVSMQITRSQAIMGTPAYMSPEQAGGRTKFVGPATDIYALGVILYECLTGKPPFAGDDSLEVIQRVVHEPPASIRRIAANVPRDLETICLNCLEKRADDRYPSAAALADDLELYLAGKPVGVRPAGPIESMIKWAKRRPTMATAYALAVAFVLVSAVGTSFAALWHRAAVARDQADSNWHAAEAAKLEVDAQRRGAESARDELAEKNVAIEMARGELAEALDRETSALAGAQFSERGAQDARRNAEDSREGLEQIRYFRNVAFANLELRGGNVLAARLLLDDCVKTRRDWEWWHAYRIAHEDAGSGCTNTIVSDIAFSGQGIDVTTVDPGARLTTFDFRIGKGVAKSLGTEPQLAQLSRFDDRAKRLLTVKHDVGTDPELATVWDVKTGKAIRKFPSTGKGSRGAAISADGRRIAISFSDPPHTTACDIETGRTLGRLDGFCHIDFLALDRTGSRGFSARQLQAFPEPIYEAVLWDTGTGEIVATHKCSTMPNAVALAPDGLRAVLGNFDGTLTVFDAETKTAREIDKAHIGTVTSVAFRPNGKQFATTGDDGVVRTWNFDNLSPVHQFRGHTRKVRRVTFDPTGEFLASFDFAQRFFIWELKGTKQGIVQLAPPAAMKGQFTVDHSTARLFSLDGRGEAFIWDSAANKHYPLTPPAKSKFTAFAFDAAGTRFAAGTDKNTVHIWDEIGGVARDFGPYPPSALFKEIGGIIPLKMETLQFSADGKRLLASDGWRMVVIETETGKKFLDREFRHAVAALSEDGTALAASWHNTATIWKLGSTAQRAITTHGVDWISCIAFNGNSDVVAVGTRDWGVYAFDLRKPVPTAGAAPPTAQFGGHTAPVTCLAFHPRGHRLVTGAGDGSVKVWDMNGGHEAISPTIPIRNPIRAAMFTPSGKDLVVVPDKVAPFILYGGQRPEVIRPAN